MRKLILIRGLSGAGKTTLARRLSRYIFSADDYFLDEDGYYNFDPKKLPQAHLACQDLVRQELNNRMREHDNPVVVHNTFSQRWEMEPYLQMIGFPENRPTVIDLFDAGFSDSDLSNRNTHQVPVTVIRQMRARWELDWGNGNPTPPWER